MKNIFMKTKAFLENSETRREILKYRMCDLFEYFLGKVESRRILFFFFFGDYKFIY